MAVGRSRGTDDLDEGRTAVLNRDMDRAQSTANAYDKDWDLLREKSRGTFMRDLGREGIKRQQERMGDTADDETARFSRNLVKRAPIKRTPPKAAVKRK